MILVTSRERNRLVFLLESNRRGRLLSPFQNLVESFHRTVSLWMVGTAGVVLDHKLLVRALMVWSRS